MTGQVIWLCLSVMTKVYAIGGCGHDNNDKQTTTTQFGDTIESTKVSSLLLETTETLMTTTTTRQNNSCQWTRLQMSLVISTKGICLAAVVHKPLHCHFGWSHTGRGQRLVISGYYGHRTTTPQQQQQQQQQQWRTNNSSMDPA